MHRREDLVPGVGGAQGHAHRLVVAELAHEDHVRVLPQRLAQALLERRRVLAHLDLRDKRLLVHVHVLDGSSMVMILQR